MALNNRET